ncbi:991_t:CDS:2 [Diversispora eburnea]|uniref:991_t:CDS:1 n=1 Tax=Diversispora eburnea TaxID=1213867 RepID=A0A9N8W2M2_9GLOM|nr:991_t:CDS:2 [Diversispora eburnea]
MHHINVDGMKLVREFDLNSDTEAREQLKSILKEIDFIHVHFNENEGEKLKIAREVALAIYMPKQAKRKRNSEDSNNKRAKRH